MERYYRPGDECDRLGFRRHADRTGPEDVVDHRNHATKGHRATDRTQRVDGQPAHVRRTSAGHSVGESVSENVGGALVYGFEVHRTQNIHAVVAPGLYVKHPAVVGRFRQQGGLLWA